MVEDDHRGSEHRLGVARLEAVIAEVKQLLRSSLVTNELKAGGSQVHVSEHFQADKVVVVQHLVVGVLNVDAKQVLEDADVEGLPVLVENMRSRSLVLEQNPQQVN